MTTGAVHLHDPQTRYRHCCGTAMRCRDWASKRAQQDVRPPARRPFEAKIRTLKRTDGLAELDAGTETLADFAEE